MENPSLAVVEEVEDFYERIEAPKFVDFTISDSSFPDHRSWFCARIGCDQKHEEIDPDELRRSFMLRVMTARSPNVRFQRALNRQGLRANTKCPQSVPAKSTKNGISRMSTLNSIKEKITMSKLKQHPISSFRETPIQKRAKLPTLTSEKKQNTTSKKNSHAKYLKIPDTFVASKDRNLVKSAGSSKVPISKICSDKKKKKKINTGGESKRMSPCSYAIGSNKCKGSSISSKNITAVGSKIGNHNILREAEQNVMKGFQIVAGSNGPENLVENNTNAVKRTNEELLVVTNYKIVSQSEASINPSKDEVENRDLKVSSGVSNQTKTTCNVTNDDDKENTLFKDYKLISDSEASINPSKDRVENRDLKVSSGVSNEIKTACNVTNDDDKENTLFTSVNNNLQPKVAISKVKSLQFQNSNPQEAQNKAFQAVKPKRTTNPKPFRLRTDERGILKEANLERKLKVEFRKEPATLFNNIQETNSQAKFANSTQAHKLDSKKQKIIQESHCKSLKMASTKQQLKITSAGEERKAPGYMQGRKPAKIPKEPKLQLQGKGPATIPLQQFPRNQCSTCKEKSLQQFPRNQCSTESMCRRTASGGGLKWPLHEI
ncbi:uncharacterized protein LOC110023379 isoform X2 [Phalaenopsis equestris]|uniref:uncharacterized protein LOC110023379 isoform X2 n=1 Tax=Phalaenopsis equestris TaxID=78828 RepID=UPI0009E25206|nr:uncharacterized protein LOC110023379 isoform X2 [Phalaenopsis equestris]